MTAWSNTPWGTADKHLFSWGELGGDFILRARVKFLGPETDPRSNIGWRLHKGDDSSGAYLNAGVFGDGRALLEYGSSSDAPVEPLVVPVKGGDVIQLERRQDRYIFSVARYGSPFLSVSLKISTLGDQVKAGLFHAPNNPSVKEEILACDVRVTRLPKVGYIPYTDYIGARLEILEVFTGKLSQVHGSPDPFEAPNWMADGHTLLYNISGTGPAKGLLRSFNLNTRKETPFDTGFAIRNNNDHVLSFDGSQLAISHHADEDEGRSVIYTLPSTGGDPRRVTPKSPSYLHGWSPDGKWLVYTGGRQESPEGPLKYDIYKIPVEGGEEIRLTDSPGLSDGPEYSPDGRYIYFNSTRSGLMQLWRMREDGSEQEQLTDDAFNNWFPHPSPNGKWIAFLSFGQDVKPDEHPYYKQVYLRLMPACGGKPCVIAYAFGGQGTINVPSWSPDGTRIAFVSNTA